MRQSPFCGARPRQPPGLGVGKALLFRPRERVLFDQHTLSLVAVPGTAEPHHHGAQRRVLARAACQRGISTLEEYQAIKVGARQAEGPFPFHAEEAPLRKLPAALGAGGHPHDPEHDDLVVPLGLSGACGGARDRGGRTHRWNLSGLAGIPAHAHAW